MLTFVFLHAIKINVPNSSRQPIIGDYNEIKNVRGPLVLDAINIQAYTAHVEGLGIQFFMAIGMMLVVWAER
jgi:hypothetical protein